MKKNEIIYLDFEVDKLTNSIENAISGEIFDTLIVKLKLAGGKSIKKTEWASIGKMKLKTSQSKFIN